MIIVLHSIYLGDSKLLQWFFHSQVLRDNMADIFTLKWFLIRYHYSKIKVDFIISTPIHSSKIDILTSPVLSFSSTTNSLKSLQKRECNAKQIQKLFTHRMKPKKLFSIKINQNQKQFLQRFFFIPTNFTSALLKCDLDIKVNWQTKFYS